MARFYTIAAKKDKTAAQKTKLYTRLGRLITIAATSEPDPDLNPDLASALRKARAHDVPKSVIEKALKAWSHDIDWASYQTHYYEWYGPGGVAIYIRALSDNTNRTSNEIRVIFQKYFWSMGEPGSVAWQFAPKWVIVVSWVIHRQSKGNKIIEDILPLDPEELELLAIELGAEDVYEQDDKVIVVTADQDYLRIDKALYDAYYHIDQSDREFVADNTIALADTGTEQLQVLIEQLEDHDDVEKVWTNVIPPL